MQIDESCVSFESGFGQQKRRITKDRFGGLLETDIAALQQKSKSMWAAIEKVRQVNGVLKREVQALADGMREDFKQKAKLKTERIEAILATIDAKVQFVVQSCDKTVQRLSEQLSHYIKAASKEAEERQAILLSYNQTSERLRSLEQKIFSHRHIEEDMKRQLEALSQQNNGLVLELNTLAARSNEKIQQLEGQLRQKVDELRRKEVDMIRREENFRKQQEHGRALTQPSLLPQNPQQAHQIQQQQQQQISAGQVSSPQGIHRQQQPQYQQFVQTKQSPQQQTLKQPPTHKPAISHPATKQPAPLLEQDISISVSRTCGNHNNAIEIKPDFFKGGQQSQLSEYSEVTEYRGINLKSLNKEQAPNGINVRKLKQSSDSGGLRRPNKKDQNHRFDYLISNLAATQGQSTQIFEGYNESVLSREQLAYQQTPNRR